MNVSEELHLPHTNSQERPTGCLCRQDKDRARGLKGKLGADTTHGGQGLLDTAPQGAGHHQQVHGLILTEAADLCLGITLYSNITLFRL